MSRGRQVDLSYHHRFGSNEDEISEESVVWHECSRNGNTEMFFETNPEYLFMKLEEDREQQTLRSLEQQRAKALCEALKTRLTPRQMLIWTLRAEGRSFGEIIAATGCSRRMVFYDWRVIRTTAQQLL